MKYLKYFENIISTSVKVDDIMTDLKVDMRQLEDSVIPKSPYDIELIEYFKEKLLNKTITFLSVNKPEGDPYLFGKVVDVNWSAYKDEFFITVKLNNENDEWNLINGQNNILIDDYDADDKPLHKEVKMKKEATKYNI